MNHHQILETIPELIPLLETADHMDVKVATGNASLQEFIAGMFSYYPTWIKNLYRIRWGFVRLLGLQQNGIPKQQRMQPTYVPMTPGAKAAFFTVAFADEASYWFASTTESHLTAYLGVIREQTTDTIRFHVVTLVHYHSWVGPIYFNVIRPFHYIVIGKMAQAGARAYLAT